MRVLALLLAGAVLWPLAPLPSAAQATQAALVAKDVTPPEGVPLGGYGQRRRKIPDLLGRHDYAHYFEPSTGMLDPIRAKVLWLRMPKEGGGQLDLAWVSLDVVGIDPLLRNNIQDGLLALGKQPDLLLVSATHTHSGPGAMSKNKLFEILVTDRFEEDVAGPFVDAVVELASQAHDTLQDAELSLAKAQTVGVQKNRLDQNGPVDHEARLLLVRTPGGTETLGAVVHYAIHGTVLTPHNLFFSHDIPGAIEWALQRELGDGSGPDPIVMFVNGAEGDVSPTTKQYEEMLDQAEDVARLLGAALPGTPISGEASFRTSETPLGNAFASLGNCGVGSSSTWGLKITPFMPTAAPIWQVDLGPLRLLTVPGEPTTAIGEELRALPHPAEKEVWVVSLTNAHLGYFGLPNQFVASPSGCGTLYGPNAGRQLVRGHCCLLGGSCP